MYPVVTFEIYGRAHLGIVEAACANGQYQVRSGSGTYLVDDVRCLDSRSLGPARQLPPGPGVMGPERQLAEGEGEWFPVGDFMIRVDRGDRAFREIRFDVPEVFIESAEPGPYLDWERDALDMMPPRIINDIPDFFT